MKIIDASRLTNRFALLLLALVGALAPRLAAQGERPAQKPRDVKHHHLDKAGLALSGYDPVAYFPEGSGKPRKGDPKLELQHEGVRYRFASEANRALFQKSPSKYEPAYGGWCAYAMAKGDKVDIDPESFLVRDGRLFLFYKGWFNDTRAKFLKDPAELTRKADGSWAKLVAPPKSS